MSYQTQDNEFRTRFNTQWANRTTVAWPNIEFTPPNPPATWCRFSISGGGANQTTFGAAANNFRHTGIVFVQIFSPSNIGDAEALQRADEVAGIFRNWCGTNLRCRTPRIRTIGTTDDGWFQVNVSIPFIRDELL